MSNYTKSTNFATKDSLETGNPSKIIKGTEIDTEFNAIASAVSSKADTASPTFTGTPAAPTASTGTDTSQIATTAFVQDALASLGTTGKIVQTVHQAYTAGYSTNNTSPTATGHYATITPTSVDSKILVLRSGGFFNPHGAGGIPSGNAYLTMYRASTNLAGSGSYFAGLLSDDGNLYASAAITYLDSPSTTSSTRYETYIWSQGDGAGIWGTTSITLVEIL